MNHEKRNLLGSTSPTHSVVIGGGIVDNTALSTYTVTVIAKNYSGVNRNVGGDLFYVQISNHCTFVSNFECAPVAGARQTIAGPIFDLMRDHGDGVYTYEYSVVNSGRLSVSVILFNQGKIHVDYYSGTTLSGAIQHTTYDNDLNIATSSTIYPGKYDYLSGRFEAYLKSPKSGTMTFYLYSRDGPNIYLDNVRQILRTLISFS